MTRPADAARVYTTERLRLVERRDRLETTDWRGVVSGFATEDWPPPSWAERKNSRRRG